MGAILIPKNLAEHAINHLRHRKRLSHTAALPWREFVCVLVDQVGEAKHNLNG